MILYCLPTATDGAGNGTTSRKIKCIITAVTGEIIEVDKIYAIQNTTIGSRYDPVIIARSSDQSTG